jgi:hypothetical protein
MNVYPFSLGRLVRKDVYSRWTRGILLYLNDPWVCNADFRGRTAFVVLIFVFQVVMLCGACRQINELKPGTLYLEGLMLTS